MGVDGLLDPLLDAGTRPTLDLHIAAALADVQARLRLEVTGGKLRAKMTLAPWRTPRPRSCAR